MTSPLTTLSHAVLRASPHYDLVQLEQLTLGQQELLSDLRVRRGFAGVLRPCRGTAGNLRAVSQDAASLYLALAQPARLPEVVRTVLDDTGAGEIAKLVLDGVLEIEDETTGGFVSGADAYLMLYRETADTAPRSVTAHLSLSALRYAQALELADPAQLSMRMYLYNRQPADARWRRTLPDAEAVISYLGMQPGGVAERLLKVSWQPVPHALGTNGWLAWHAPERTTVSKRDKVTYKLYISAPCEHMPNVFPEALSILADHKTIYLKVGSDLCGLLRPDKMVAYFHNFAELCASGAALGQALAGIPAQGVPFTATLDEAALLCWGMDPPGSTQWLRWQPRESWRLWVTNRLAVYMVAARNGSASSLEPWQFALERMRVDGIDVSTWTPQTSIWDMDAEQGE